MPQFTAITPQQFANKNWTKYTSYAFAARTHAYPIVLAELVKAAPAMPLGFMETEGSFQLMAITALRPGANLFVGPDGQWLGGHLPSSLLSNPFRLFKPQNQDESILCFDVDSDLLVDAGQGIAFFDEAGGPSLAVKDALNLLTQIEISRTVTQQAVNALQTAGLIQPWPINVRDADSSAAIKGLYRIDEAALNALPDKDFLALRKSGALPVAYAQLLSINQLGVLETLSQLQVKLQAQKLKATKPAAGLGDFSLSLDNGTIKFD